MTLLLNKLVAARRQDLAEAWMSGNFDASLTAEFIAANAAAKGACSAYKEVLDINLETFKDFLDE